MLSNTIVNTVKNLALENSIDPAVLLAVVEVESSGTPFWKVNGEDRPIIRFEGHYFYARLSGDKLDRAIKEGLASKKAGGVKNPSSGSARYELLERASKIDKKAAYESVSWGLGQVMGSHWDDLGYSSVTDLADAANTVEGQIDMMIRFIKQNYLLDELERKDWRGFAKGYNGKNYAAGGYHTKLEKAYKKWAGKDTDRVSADNDEVIQLQTMLNTVGKYGITVDGKIGPETKAAIRDFQLKNGLVSDGIYGPLTKEKLTKVYLELGKKGQGMFGAGATTIGIVGSGITEAAKSIQEFVYGSTILQAVFLGLIVIGAGFTIWSLWKKGQNND